jgi:hypothetical protein
MLSDDPRKKLLAEFALALVAERAAWERLSEPQLSEVERCHCLAEWKPTAARVKSLAQQIRGGALPDSGFGSQAARPGEKVSVSVLQNPAARASLLSPGASACAAHWKAFVRAAAAFLSAA